MRKCQHCKAELPPVKRCTDPYQRVGFCSQQHKALHDLENRQKYMKQAFTSRSQTTERRSKYRAQKTEYNGYTYDSKFEAGVAQQLDMRLKAGEIKHWERQFKIECVPFNCHGEPLPRLKVTHKVDFRIHHHDGSFELLEAKGVELTDYRRRRKWLEDVWLPEHPDHTYTVVKDGGNYKRSNK